MAEKKNIDYSKSAVNLTNKAEIEISLIALSGLKAKIVEVENKIESLIPQELKDTLASLKTQKEACENGIKSEIESLGSYQDLDRGLYALKQRKVSVIESYNATKFEEKYPKFKDAVLTKVVNVPTLKALIKADQISEEGLITDGVLTVTREESFQYIIKV